MTCDHWLKLAAKRLSNADVPMARLDCMVLLEDVTGHDRAWILAHNEFELSQVQIARLDAMLERRAQHEPLSYIRNNTEFYGRAFYIDHSVLEPRPESETMIELLKVYAQNNDTVIDIGTGSGALAITAKLELPGCSVLATDIDPECLRVAKRNAASHAANIEFGEGDLLAPHIGKANNAILLCNLPYVPSSHTINKAAMHEPEIAIFGGEDGLDLYRKLFEQIRDSHNYPRIILAESLPFQHPALSDLATEYGYVQDKEDDFIQAFTSSQRLL